MQPTDRVRDALLDALGRALTAGGEHRLFKAGKLDGLFAARAGASGEAASRALADGLLERARLEVKGKTEIEWVRVTPRGVEYLHEHESPVRALHELQTTLRANQNAIPVWLDQMQAALRRMSEQLTADAGRWVEQLQALDRRVGETLRRLEASGPLVPDEIAHAHPWAIDALNYLDRRRTSGASDPCPLPELFDAVAGHHPSLELLGFKDGLKDLHRRKALLLLAAPSPEQITRVEFALYDEAMVYYLAVR
jgi:hypothetical protein